MGRFKILKLFILGALKNSASMIIIYCVRCIVCAYWMMNDGRDHHQGVGIFSGRIQQQLVHNKLNGAKREPRIHHNV
jgi:hypothetical protein